MSGDCSTSEAQAQAVLDAYSGYNVHTQLKHTITAVP